MQLTHIPKKREDVMSTVAETSRLRSIDSLTAPDVLLRVCSTNNISGQHLYYYPN